MKHKIQTFKIMNECYAVCTSKTHSTTKLTAALTPGTADEIVSEKAA